MIRPDFQKEIVRVLERAGNRGASAKSLQEQAGIRRHQTEAFFLVLAGMVKSGEKKGVPAGRKNPSRNAFVPCICSPLSLDALAGVSPAPPRGEPSVRVSTPVNGAVRQSCK